MKKKQLSKKLALNKITIINLSDLEMKRLRGKDGEVVACLTEPEPSCPNLSIDSDKCTKDEPICNLTKPDICPEPIE